MHVNDVVLAFRKDLPELATESDAERHTRLRAVRVDGLAMSHSNDVRLGGAALDVRRDYVDVMTEPSRLAREEVNMLDDSAKMRIVVFGYERDAKRARKRRLRRYERRSRSELELASETMLR